MRVTSSSRTKLRLPVALLLTAIAMAAGYAVIQAVADPSNPWTSVLPLQSTLPSKSMEPYFISLKLRLPSPKATEGTFAEWRLVVPRAFLFSETGRSESVGRGGPTYSAVLAAIRSEDGISFDPGIFAAKQDQADVALISISNTPANSKVSSICLRVNDHDSVFHDGYRGMSGCDTKNARSKRCSVRTGFQGWDVNILMPAKHYNGDYEKYCRSTLHFLKKHTRRITALPSGIE